MENLTRLNIPCPPMFEKALGYNGRNRRVAFYWEPSGDEIVWDDGNQGADGEWYAWLVFVRHPLIRLSLLPYNLGSSDEPAAHWLLLDREERVFYIGDCEAVRRVLTASAPALSMSDFEHFENLERFLEWAKEQMAEKWSQFKTGHIDLAAIMEENDRNFNSLREWLDFQLPEK